MQEKRETAKRILVIDDEDDLRDIVQVSLEAVAHWHVLTATSGSEGVAKAQTEHPDAILLDIMMPDMDGQTTLRALQQEPTTRHIPVLFFTAKVQSADCRTYAATGAAGIIPKPFDPLQLAAEVAHILGWRQ